MLVLHIAHSKGHQIHATLQIILETTRIGVYLTKSTRQQAETTNISLHKVKG